MIFRLLGVPVDRKQGSYVLKHITSKQKVNQLKWIEINRNVRRKKDEENFYPELNVPSL